MREVLNIGVGNVSCAYLSEYFNRLNDYLPHEEYNSNVLFANRQPRVIFIDNINEFNILESVPNSTTTSSSNIENLNWEQSTFKVRDHDLNEKSWFKDFQFRGQLKDYNHLSLDYFKSSTELLDDREPPMRSSITEHQRIINNMMLCDQINNDTQYNERLDECLRQNVETCDSLSGFQLVSHICSPIYMLKCGLMDLLNDDYSNKVVLDFSLENTGEKKLPQITKGFQSIAKLLTINHFYQNKSNCFIPYNNNHNNNKNSWNAIDNFIDSIHQLNSLFCLPHNINNGGQSLTNHHSLNQFVCDMTNIPFGGGSIGGLIGCALDPTANQFGSLVNQLESWSQLENGLGKQLQPAHSLLPHTNQLHTQYLCVGECTLGNFMDFYPKLSQCKWRQALNLHIPRLSIRDALDGFLRYNYYGAKSYSFVFPKVAGVGSSKNKVVSFYNGKQSYNYIHDMYVSGEKCVNSLIKRIAITDRYTTNYNKDHLEDVLSNFLKVLTLYDSTRAFEDFGVDIDYED